MPDINQLVERHILEHEARLKHIDELMDQVERAKQAADSPEAVEEFKDLQKERRRLIEAFDRQQTTPAESWAEKGGPMIMWDILAERLEKLVERLKH
ncbi:MAG: hypothetical protein RRB22_13450 [Gammaproteobacteria bacterium]|nr:hypothetical protein [Gammaproteobacteria bacterium]